LFSPSRCGLGTLNGEDGEIMGGLGGSSVRGGMFPCLALVLIHPSWTDSDKMVVFLLEAKRACLWLWWLDCEGKINEDALGYRVTSFFSQIC